VPETLHIVIPVYNEADSFPQVWAELCSRVKCDFQAFVVYDFDEDNTVPVVNAVLRQGEARLRLLKNNVGRGVVGAIRTGFNEVRSGAVLVVMADLSDDLAQVDRMFELYREGNQVVVGSRYMKGGRLIGGPWFKQALSRLAGVSLCWLRGVPTHDATNAFKIYDREMLSHFTIESRGGFELNLELTVKAFLAGYRIAEIPAVWRDRTAGESHFALWKWLPRYLHWYFFAFQPRRKTQPLAHATVERG
jgi:dolichol-phosphate mannosyltransferase